MQTILPKMGAPLRVMTASTIEAERNLFLKTGYNISHRARVLGIKRSTLSHHLRDLLASQSMANGKIPPTVAALIEAGNALFKHAPSNAISARQDWIIARMAITKRRRDCP